MEPKTGIAAGSKGNIEAETLTQVPRALKVPKEAIKNFDEEKAI